MITRANEPHYMSHDHSLGQKDMLKFILLFYY
jgi:hypothetical protein